MTVSEVVALCASYYETTDWVFQCSHRFVRPMVIRWR